MALCDRSREGGCVLLFAFILVHHVLRFRIFHGMSFHSDFLSSIIIIINTFRTRGFINRNLLHLFNCLSRNGLVYAKWVALARSGNLGGAHH